MDKARLAQELRARQREHGGVSADLIRLLSDDQIIDAYITCSCCGEKQAEGSELDYAITTANDTDHFLEIAAKFGQIKHAVNQQFVDQTKEAKREELDLEDVEMEYEDVEMEEDEEEPVYQQGDVALFEPDLMWTVYEVEDEEDLYLNMDAILQTSWDALVSDAADDAMQEPARMTAEQAQRCKDFAAGRFWLEEVTASIEIQIGEAMPVTLESIANPVVVASDAKQSDHLSCERSAVANLVQVLTRMGLDGGRILREVKFERYRETPKSELALITYVPGKSDNPQKGPTDRTRKARRFDGR